MSLFDPARSPWPARALSLLRIGIGFFYITYGTMKMFNFPPVPAGMPPIHYLLGSELGVAGLLETVGGTLILLGLFTRPVAFILAGEMAVAYFQFHFPMGFFPQTNNGSPAVLYCFLFLYFMVVGAGPWSMDAMLARSRRGGVAYQ